MIHEEKWMNVELYPKELTKQMTRARIKNIIIISFFCSIVSGCTNKERDYSFIYELINKLERIDSSELKGFSVTKRGVDNCGNDIIYISRTTSHNPFKNSGNIEVSINNSGQIVTLNDSEYDLRYEDSVIIQMVQLYNYLDVGFLGFGLKNTIFISFSLNEPLDLIRSKEITSLDLQLDFEQIENNSEWWVRQD